MKKKKKNIQEQNYIAIFLISLVLTIVTHWIIFSRINMHSTLHVLIALLLFWAIMGLLSVWQERKRKQ